MATINGTTIGDMTLQADYSYTQNTSANTSTVTVALKLINHYALYATAMSGSYISVGGSKTNYTKSISYGGSTTTSTTLATKTVTVTHNSNGTATCNIAGTFVMNGTYRGYSVGTMSVNQTITLPTIPRSSSLTVPATINTGGTLSGTVTPSSSAFNHKVYLKTGSTTRSTISLAAGTKTFSDVIEHSWFPSSTSGTLTVILETYNGTTLVASTSKSVTANVPTSIVPSVSALTAAVVDGKSGYYVQNKSKVTLTATATAGSGASIKSYAFSGTNMSASGTAASATSSVLQYSGAKTYTVTVTDTRGRTASKNVSITVQPYAAPTISSISVQRCTSNGTIDENGTYAYVTVNSSYSTLNGANTRTVVLTNNANGTATTVQGTTNTSGSWSGVYGSGFAVGTTYTITATIKDTAYSATATKSGTLKAASRPMNIKSNGKGIAFGKMAESDNLLDVSWNERVRGNLSVDGNTAISGTLVANGKTTFGGDLQVNNNSFIKGHLYMGGNKEGTIERSIRFTTPDDSTYPHNTYIFGGNAEGPAGIGIYDAKNSRVVFSYNDMNNSIIVGNSTTINLNGQPLKDFVIEQGMTGIWTWKKWFSGTCECWGNVSINPTTANGLNSTTVNLPFTFANDDFIVNITPAKCGLLVDRCGDCNTSNAMVHTTSSFVLSYNYAHGTIYTTSFNVMVKGKWK